MTALLAARPRKPISLTALIDVVFILLMFFMLTSSFTTRHETRLHTATAAAGGSTPTEPLLLALSPAGEWLRLPGLETTDSQWLQGQPGDSAILVYPQAATQVQTIVSQMHELRQMGFAKVNLGDALEP